MSEKTYLTGKTDYLESSIDRMQQALQRYGFSLDFSQWLNPAPYIYSVHVKEGECPALFANGKGISEKACQASAMGEFIERIGNHYLFADYYLGQRPYGFLMHPQEKSIAVADFKREDVLTPSLWSLYDSQQQLAANDLVALQDADHRVTSIPLTAVGSNALVYFPINLLNSLYASNGLAAGNSLLEAAIQGLSEILERWVRIQILKNGWCLPCISAEVWQSYPRIVAAIEKLSLHGLECDIRDASLGGRYPVIAIIVRDVETGQSMVSFGAHPLFEVAIERTLTESLQGRLLNERDAFAYPIVDMETVASDENCEMHFIDASGLWHLRFFADTSQADFTAHHWDFSGDIEAQWQQLLYIVQQEGHQVYWSYHQQLALYVVRIVVPGMSEIYPMQDLLDGNANRGIVLRQALNCIDWDKDRSFEIVLHVLEEQAYSAHTRVASLIGLLPDPGTPWFFLTVAELKLGCLLYLGDFEAAQQALSEVLSLGRDTAEYLLLDMALTLTINEQLEAQVSALVNLFGEERWQAVVQWLDGETFIWDIELVDVDRYSARHQALLKAHDKINRALVS